MATDEQQLEVALGQLAKMLAEQSSRHKVLREEMKVDFNPFTVVLKGHDETRLHSRVIGHFLDPQGNHYCGVLFLREFFEVVGWTPPCGLAEKELEKARIDLERSIGSDGRLDIVIEAPTWIVAIENKIWAGEQTDQLRRYQQYLRKDKKEKVSHLVYLTPYGKKGETAEKNEEQEDSQEGAGYLRISYCDHMIKWLDRCLEKTWKWPNINLALQQYQQVVADQTGQSLSRKNIMDISEIFIKHPKLLRDFNKIEGAKIVAQQKAMGCFIDLLRKELGGVRGYVVDDIFSRPGITLSRNEVSFLQKEKVLVSVEFHETEREVWIGIASDKFSKKQRGLHEMMLKDRPQNIHIWGDIPKNQKKSWDGSFLCGSGCVYSFRADSGDHVAAKEGAFYAVMLGDDVELQAQIIKLSADRIDCWFDAIKVWE